MACGCRKNKTTLSNQPSPKTMAYTVRRTDGSSSTVDSLVAARSVAGPDDHIEATRVI